MEVSFVDISTGGAATVFRCALYDKCLDSGGAFSRVKVSSPFSRLKDRERDTYALSVGLCAMFTSEAHRHDFGCRVAVQANAYFATSKGRPPLRGAETIHYIGGFQLNIEDVLRLESDVFDIGICHHPEENLEEHGHIELVEKSNDISNTKKRGETTRIAVMVADLLFDPQPFISDSDLDIAETLSAVRID